MSAPPRHPIVHLPALTADEAWLLLRVLDRLHDAIWQAHGPDIERRREELAAGASGPRPAPPPPDDLPF